MAQVIPPLPYKSPVITQTGFLSEPWSKWFRQMFIRIGGIEALSNVELAALPALELAAVEADITSLETSVTTLQATVTSLQAQINDLNQGPVL